MKKRSEIIGLPILDKKDGHKISSVRDIICCRKKVRVLGFLVHEGNLFKEPRIIRLKNIETIGKDAIMIKNKLSIEKLCDIPEIDQAFHHKSKIIDEEVITEDGESIGLVHDIIVDEDSGKIMAFVISGGFIDDIRDGRSILPYSEDISIGDEALIVSKKLQMTLDKNKEDFKKLLGLLS